MNRYLLRWINPPSILLLALVGVALQGSLFTFWLLPYFQPDIVLLAVIWCALRRSFFEGGLLTLLMADIVELHSASPQGMFLIVYMAIYLGVRLADRIFVIPDVRSYVVVTLFASVISKASAISMLHLLGVGAAQWTHILIFVFPTAVMNGLLASWLFQKLDRFDWITYKTPRAGQMLEDEMQLEVAEL